MSNFILAKAFQKLGVGESFISILGDTVDGDVEKGEAFNMYETYCDVFDLDVSKVFYASKMEFKGDLLKDGEDKYEGTKVFDSGDEKIVGIKSNGSTTYFYQDMALAEELDGPTLYLTGNEQDNHFAALKKFHPHTNHTGLGLVIVDSGKKMGTRHGNAYYFND